MTSSSDKTKTATKSQNVTRLEKNKNEGQLAELNGDEKSFNKQTYFYINIKERKNSVFHFSVFTNDITLHSPLSNSQMRQTYRVGCEAEFHSCIGRILHDGDLRSIWTNFDHFNDPAKFTFTHRQSANNGS